MSSKGKNPYADWEFLRSAFTEKREVEHAFDVVVTAAFSLRDSPFRMVIRLEAWEASQTSVKTPLCSYECHWPNEQTVSFAATVFRAHVMLSRLVEDSRALDWGKSLRAQKGG